jgi:amino acid transporter
MLFLAMTSTLFAFVGLEVATVPAGAVKDPAGPFRARPSSARWSRQ